MRDLHLSLIAALLCRWTWFSSFYSSSCLLWHHIASCDLPQCLIYGSGRTWSPSFFFSSCLLWHHVASCDLPQCLIYGSGWTWSPSFFYSLCLLWHRVASCDMPLTISRDTVGIPNGIT